MAKRYKCIKDPKMFSKNLTLGNIYDVSFESGFAVIKNDADLETGIPEGLFAEYFVETSQIEEGE